MNGTFLTYKYCDGIYWLFIIILIGNGRKINKKRENFDLITQLAFHVKSSNLKLLLEKGFSNMGENLVCYVINVVANILLAKKTSLEFFFLSLFSFLFQ